MNNDEDIETLLGALRPAALPEALRARLEPPRRAPRNHAPWRWAAALGAPLAAAACWWLMAPASRPDTRPAPTAHPTGGYQVFHSVKETSRVVAVEDLPLLNPGSPNPTGLRVVQWVDDTTYVGENPHSILRQEQPRSQVIPVSFETY